MAVVDVSSRTITLKLVYYGCALGGKTTNLVSLHQLTDPNGRQGLVSIATNDDRTLFFDLLPVELGQVNGMNVKIKVYTVPGQVHYELTRRQVLSGADAVVLVIDSDPEAEKANLWAAENLRMNLRQNGLDPDSIPIVLQWNKQDLRNARSVDALQGQLNPRGLPAFPAVATTGRGVLDTFSSVMVSAILRAWTKAGRSDGDEQQIRETVGRALGQARQREGSLAPTADTSFKRRFDMDAYKDDQAERGRDRRVVDQESLLSESVQTSMMLAERLDSLRTAQDVGQRRGTMMAALSRMAPGLADPAVDAIPPGVMASLLRGAGRKQGSLLLIRATDAALEDREVVPGGGTDPLNEPGAGGLDTLASRLRPSAGVRLIEDLATEVFFGPPPPGFEDLASVLIAPLVCDGLKLGSLHVYGQLAEPGFDDTETEYWSTAAILVGLSLHWRALRRKVAALAGKT